MGKIFLNLVGFFLYCGREVGNKALAGDNRLHFRFVDAGRAEAPEHFACRQFVGVVPTLDFNDHFFSLAGTGEIIDRDNEIEEGPRSVGDEEVFAFLFSDGADKLAPAVFKHFLHLTHQAVFSLPITH